MSEMRVHVWLMTVSLFLRGQYLQLYLELQPKWNHARTGPLLVLLEPLYRL